MQPRSPEELKVPALVQSVSRDARAMPVGVGCTGGEALG